MSTTIVDFCHTHGYDDGGSPEMFHGLPFWDAPCQVEEWECVVPDAATIGEPEEVHSVNDEDYHTLRSGDLAYIDTVQGGLVPCKIISINEHGQAQVQVTAARMGWTNHAIHAICSPLVSLIHRDQVRRITTGNVTRTRVTGSVRLFTDGGRELRA